MFDSDDEAIDRRLRRPLEDREYPEPDDDGDPLERLCPHCGQWIDADYEQCPECDQWITGGPGLFSTRPWWFLLIGAAGALALVWALLRV